MSEELKYDLCPETGIGCLMIGRETGALKIDLMPDEAASLRHLVKSGDLNSARELLVNIDPSAEAALSDERMTALAGEIR